MPVWFESKAIVPCPISLGELSKDETRHCPQVGLGVAAKPDSQEIASSPIMIIAAFSGERFRQNPAGPFLDVEGNILGPILTALLHHWPASGAGVGSGGGLICG